MSQTPYQSERLNFTRIETTFRIIILYIFVFSAVGSTQRGKRVMVTGTSGLALQCQNVKHQHGSRAKLSSTFQLDGDI
jgi:hypothetical protein